MIQQELSPPHLAFLMQLGDHYRAPRGLNMMSHAMAWTHGECSINVSLLEMQEACVVPGGLWKIYHRQTVLKSYDFQMPALGVPSNEVLCSSELVSLDAVEWEQ